jgi:hypothetical protein
LTPAEDDEKGAQLENAAPRRMERSAATPADSRRAIEMDESVQRRSGKQHCALRGGSHRLLPHRVLCIPLVGATMSGRALRLLGDG